MAHESIASYDGQVSGQPRWTPAVFSTAGAPDLFDFVIDGCLAQGIGRVAVLSAYPRMGVLLVAGSE